MTRPTIAVHDLGGTGPTKLYAHAAGFHARVWAPIARRRPDSHNIAYDARGHGDTPVGDDWPDGVHWNEYGDDAGSVAEGLAAEGPIVGVGHSMGGAALLLAASARPELFGGLIVYEPIVFPPSSLPGRTFDIPASGARRRRTTFPSYDAAIDNFASKPPLDVIAREALEEYVGGGFRLGEDGQVHIKCAPEHEARTYEASGGHDTWDRLADVRVPVWVISGHPEEMRPSEEAQAIAELIPVSTYVQLDHLGHFGPMEAPDEIAELIDRAAASF